MQVDVTTRCSRCHKKEKKTLSLEEANTLNEQMEAAVENTASLRKNIREILLESDVKPGLIVAMPTASGDFDVKILLDLCSNADTNASRSCQSRVDTLVKDLFLLNPPKKKAKKGSTDVPKAVPEESGD